MILADKKCIPSAMLLRNKIHSKIGVRLLVTSNPLRIKKRCHIRYGNSALLKPSIEDTEFNPSSFIRMISFKKKLADFLADEVNLHTPRFFSSPPLERDYPIIVRTHLTKSGGKGMTVCKTKEEFEQIWRRNYWVTPYIPTDYELRLHILGGDIVKTFIKKYVGEEPESEFPLRNMDKGYHFSLVNMESKSEAGVYKKLRDTVGEIWEAVGNIGKFFSLDVGWDSAKKEYLIFEANSASGLNPNTAEVYADWFISQDIL